MCVLNDYLMFVFRVITLIPYRQPESLTAIPLLPLDCKQAIFIFYIQWLIFLLNRNTMKNTMLRKSFKILEKIAD